MSKPRSLTAARIVFEMASPDKPSLQGTKPRNSSRMLLSRSTNHKTKAICLTLLISATSSAKTAKNLASLTRASRIEFPHMLTISFCVVFERYVTFFGALVRKSWNATFFPCSDRKPSSACRFPGLFPASWREAESSLCPRRAIF